MKKFQFPSSKTKIFGLSRSFCVLRSLAYRYTESVIPESEKKKKLIEEIGGNYLQI